MTFFPNMQSKEANNIHVSIEFMIASTESIRKSNNKKNKQITSHRFVSCIKMFETWNETIQPVLLSECDRFVIPSKSN